jgi:hypothetical protein
MCLGRDMAMVSSFTSPCGAIGETKGCENKRSGWLRCPEIESPLSGSPRVSLVNRVGVG